MVFFGMLYCLTIDLHFIDYPSRHYFLRACARHILSKIHICNVAENGGEGGRGSAQKGVIKASECCKISGKVMISL